MTEGIRKRGEKYSFRINVKDPKTDKWRNIERGGFDTVSQAKHARALLLADYAKSPTKIVVEDKKITLKDLHDDFLFRYATKDRTISTITRYKSLFKNHLNPNWGDMIVSKIPMNDISDYLFSMTATHSYAYIMSIHKYIVVLWNYAYERQYIRENPISRVKTPMEGNEEGNKIKIYTQEELDMFEKRFSTTQSITAFKIGRATGVRVGECYGLLWSDIDWENHTMRIDKQMVYEEKMWTLRHTKTKSSIRTIDIQDSLYNYLKELREIQLKQKAELGVAYKINRIAVEVSRNKPKEIRTDLELINIKENGELLTPDSEKFLGRISRKELPVNFKFHNLRHTHCSWLSEHNVPVVVTQKRLGHSKIETTLKYYTHITEGMRNNLVDLLNQGNT